MHDAKKQVSLQKYVRAPETFVPISGDATSVPESREKHGMTLAWENWVAPTKQVPPHGVALPMALAHCSVISQIHTFLGRGATKAIGIRRSSERTPAPPTEHP